MKLFLNLLGILLLAGLLQACGSSAYVKGEYDKDINSENLLTDKWSETDMQKTVEDLVAKMVTNRTINEAKKIPIVMVTKLQNKTDEQIDTQSVTDMITVELSNTGKVQFVDKAARGDVSEEYDYQNSGMMSEETKKSKGGQIGADYIINGRLDKISQEDGTNKTVYYKVTLMLTNLKTNIIEWTGNKQMRKMYKKRRVAL
jgi:penicillin-binding protein activator